MKTVAKIICLSAMLVASEAAYTVHTADYQLEVKVGKDEWMDVGLNYCVMEETEGDPTLPDVFVKASGKIDISLTDKNTRLAKITGTEGSMPCYERTVKKKNGKTKKECTDYHVDSDREGKYRVYDC